MNVREEAWAKVLIINNDLVCKLKKKSRIVWSSFQLHECSMSFCYISVQSLSRVRLFVTPCIAARHASLSITNSQSLLKPMPIESVMPSSHLILCRLLLLLPPIPPSIRVFSNESTLRMRWPKYWSFSFSISPSSEHPGLLSFRMDWLYLGSFISNWHTLPKLGNCLMSYLWDWSQLPGHTQILCVGFTQHQWT